MADDFIFVVDNALPDECCDALINQFDISEYRTEGRIGSGVDHTKKLSEDIHLNEHQEFSSLLQQIYQHTTEHVSNYLSKYFFALIGATSIALPEPSTGKLTTLTEQNFSTLGQPNLMSIVKHLYRLGAVNAQKYSKGKGGYPHWHSEVYPQLPDNEPLHRVLLFMYYLNDVTEGGETEFYYQNRKVQAKKGRMVIAPAYFTHTHRGNMPKSNDKYIVTSWVSFNRAEQMYK